jgi:hypothetical protein
MILLPVAGGAQVKISLGNPVTCSFQVGQYIDLKETRTYSEKGVLEWNFFELLTQRPRFLSGGDTGSVLVNRHDRSNGVSVLLAQGNGAHLFSIWPDGTAFWSKHNDLVGLKATQQFRGTCINVREVDK